MRLPKWLLQQMTRMEITCSKKEKVKTWVFAFSFYYKTSPKRPLKYLKNGGEISKCSQIVAKFRFLGKRKNANNLFCKLLTFLASGVTRK